MKKTTFIILLSSIITLPLCNSARADEECEGGKVQKCFVDGTATTCTCLDAPTDVQENPASEPDGQENPDE